MRLTRISSACYKAFESGPGLRGLTWWLSRHEDNCPHDGIALYLRSPHVVQDSLPYGSFNHQCPILLQKPLLNALRVVHREV